MKKVVIVLFVLLALIADGLAVFLATFNADRYRPMVVEKLTQALGTPVGLGRLSLVWRNGIALRLENLTVYMDAQKRAASVKVKEASAVVRLMPLLHKEIQVSSVVVNDAGIYLIKTPDGKVQIKGVHPPSMESGASAPSGRPSQPAPIFAVDSFKMRNGEIRFEDSSSEPPLDLDVKSIDVDVKNFSLSKPFSFSIRASMFSAKQNFQLTGRLTLPQEEKGGVLENGVFKTDLAQLNMAALSGTVPVFASAGIRGPLAGALNLKIDRMDLDPEGTGSLKATLGLEDGRIRLSSVKSPLENIQLSAIVNGQDMTVQNFSSNFAQGTLKASGMVKQFRTRARSGFSLSASNLDINELMPASLDPRAPKLNGRLSADFDGQAAGTAGPQITQTLQGRGRVSLRDGVILNYNLLRQVIDKVSIIPGARDMILSRLPGNYQAKLNEPSTLLRPVELPVTVQNGQVILDRLELATDLVAIRGAGQVGLDKTISARAAVQLDRDLSGVIAASVPQIQLLLNSQGQLEVPVQIQGRLPQVMILPDTDYIGQKLLVSKAQELVTGLVTNPDQTIQQVRNVLDKPTAAGEAGVKNSLEGLNGLKNLLKQAVSQDNAGGQ